MAVRIVHCSRNIANYNICLDKEIVGFTHRGALPDDIIYLVFRKGKETCCGARFILDDVTDERPWEDSDRYCLCYSVKNIEFCTIFNVGFLREVGGEYWHLKYFQASKALDEKAAAMLDEAFQKNKSDIRVPLKEESDSQDDLDEQTALSEKEREKIEKEIPNAKINIMGTFQTINFLNESDGFRGLEHLVSEHFFELFPNKYKKESSILISKNRLFKTHLMDEKIVGVSGIPDAILITFSAKRPCPIHVSLVEYECYGEGKTNPSQRSKYMSGHIIPQLMQFASSFSIITDQKTRKKTIDDWIEKIVSETTSEVLSAKIDSWVKELNPEISTRAILSFFEKQLKEAFRRAVHVFLIIDDLSGDQKETIKNIITSFKLESGEDIQFDCAIVKLVQKISILNEEFEYGLTAQ